MEFTVDIWRERAAEKLKGAGRWLDLRRKQEAPYLIYGGLCGLTLAPLVEAAAGASQSGGSLPISLVLALGSVAGGVGSDLIAAQIQRWIDRKEGVSEDEIADWVAAEAGANEKLHTALDTALKNMQAIPQAEAALAEDDRAWFAETLQAELAELGNLARFEITIQDAVVAFGDGAVAVGGDLITGDTHYHGDPAGDPEQALRVYRKFVVQESSHLPLRGVDVGASDPTGEQRPLGLANVYIDLDTTMQKEIVRDGRKEGEEPAEREPLPALGAVAQNRQVVLLGDPGGGKSTFVSHLAHCLAAHGLEPGAGWLDHLPGWPEDSAERLPIVVILRDFARSLPDPLPAAGERQHLWDFIAGRLDAQGLDFAKEPIRQVLDRGEALVLLDGLDEVTTTSQRAFVRDAVLDFEKRFPGNRTLVTCRVLAYQPPEPGKADLRLNRNDYPAYELAPFDEEKIDRFIGGWYAELARLGTVRDQDVAGLTHQLQGAVRRPDLWRLAPNPLLLTVMALIHTHKGRLPDARALLYEDTVDLLLWRWEQLKSGGWSDTPHLRQLLLDAGRSETDLKRVLWRLAYEAHGQTEDGDDDALAGISELKLTKALAVLNEDNWKWARQVIEAMKLRAGLLLERAPEIFSFPHRTFQEYLAGAHLSNLPDFARQSCRLAEEGNQWREVILLATGRLVYLSGNDGLPLALAAELCPSGVGDNAVDWAKTWLAADVLLEMGIKRVEESDHGQDLLGWVRYRLQELVSKGKLAPRERAAAGDSLARLGDYRPGIGVQMVNGVSIPDIALCYVPKGKFWMGGGEEDPQARENEKPIHEVDIPYGYWIGRYPVTVAQFQAYLKETGRQPKSERSIQDPPNRPVRFVTWDEALAFCRWLTGAWREAGWLPQDWSISLPSEAEWEKAARGGLEIPVDQPPVEAGGLGRSFSEPALKPNPDPQRIYPWGGEADSEMANYGETGIGTTCAVGSFPAGQSPYCVLDISGNVFEWTRSRWGKAYQKPDFGYPYDPADGREDLDARDWRVLRGGAFTTNSSWLRCASRHWLVPSYRRYLYGFRVVASPFPTLDSDPSDL